MFVLAYPNDKKSVLRHCNQCYDLVRKATKFLKSEMFVMMYRLEYKIETTVLINFHKTGAVVKIVITDFFFAQYYTLTT